MEEEHTSCEIPRDAVDVCGVQDPDDVSLDNVKEVLDSIKVLFEEDKTIKVCYCFVMGFFLFCRRIDCGRN